MVILLKLLFYLRPKHWKLQKPLLSHQFSSVYTVNHDILLSMLTELGNFGGNIQLVWILPHWTFIQCFLAGPSIKISSPLHWCTSGIDTWSPSSAVCSSDSLGTFRKSLLLWIDCLLLYFKLILLLCVMFFEWFLRSLWTKASAKYPSLNLNIMFSVSCKNFKTNIYETDYNSTINWL